MKLQEAQLEEWKIKYGSVGHKRLLKNVAIIYSSEQSNEDLV